MSFNFDQLAAPFPGSKIHFRVGPTNSAKTQGIAFAYLDARDVMERLDQVCGAAGWQDDYPFKGCCRIGIKVGAMADREGGTKTEWIWKADGAGETSMEADKGQFSDSFKRAAVKWGIGRYLYDMPNVWFPIIQQGRSYVFEPEILKELAARYDAWVENYFKQLKGE